MRYAIISDVHSNLEALSAVLSDMDNRGKTIDKIICLGDIVGYNAEPNECIDLIKSRSIISVMGNHDSRAVDLVDAHKFNPMAREAVEWTKKVLTKNSINFLKELPLTIEIDDTFLAAHGWVNDTDSYIYTESDAEDNLTLMEQAEGNLGILFFGHTHQSAIYMQGGALMVIKKESTIKIEPGTRYLVNPGAVGQPRDGDPRAAYAVYDTEDAGVSFIRVEYDLEAAVKKILDAGLSANLGERLKMGR